MSNLDQTTAGGNNHPPAFRSVKYVFTLNNYEEEDINLLILYFKDNAKKWIFGEEVGDSGTPHLQGYMEFRNQKKWIVIKEKCEPLQHAYSARAYGSLEANYDYCTKQGIKFYYGGFKINKLKFRIQIELRPWQQNILNILDSDGDDRTIHWYWEPDGGMGKTTFQKWLYLNRDGVLILSGKASDMKHAIIQYIEKNGETPDIILVNIPKSSIDFVSYQGLEEIKDMCFFSGKYEGGMVVGPNPHVIVFANEEPHYEKMTNTRWNVVRI